MRVRFDLMFFSLRYLTAYGFWKAGADMFGGTERRQRVAAYLAVRDMAADALRRRD